MNYVRSLEFNYTDKIDKTLLLKAALGGLAGLGIFYIGKICYSYKFFKKRGIKTPKYGFVTGNLPEIIKKNYSNALREWTELYGPIYGYYDGHLPILVTSDLDFIHEVFFKQFENFTARKRLQFVHSDNSKDIPLVFATKNRWKRMRTVLNSTFSPAKLKEILPLMRICSDRFIQKIDENLDKEIEILPFVNNLTMDVLWNCAFGIDVDCQNATNNPFIMRTFLFLQIANNFNFFMIFMALFYELKAIILPIIKFNSYILNKIHPNLGHPLFWLLEHVNQIIQQRMSKKTYRKDLIQLMVDAQSDEIDTNKDNLSIKDLTEGKHIVDKKITPQEIKFNLVNFLVAGHETTSTSLNLCLHFISIYPTQMRILQAEVDKNYPSIQDLENLDYESVNRLEYLDFFIKEVLRMYPIGDTFVNRRCTKQTNINGIDIPEGLIIAVDVLSLHYNPDYWGPVDPNEFNPLRFSNESSYNKQAYMPFGLGQRTCLGMRFALLELKITLAKILYHYNIFPSKDSKEKLEIIEGITRRPKNKIKCIFRKRK